MKCPCFLFYLLPIIIQARPSTIRPSNIILAEAGLNASVTATSTSVYTQLQKITQPQVLTIPDEIIEIFKRVNEGYQLTSQEALQLKLCRISAGRMNGRLKEMQGKSFLDFLKFDSNKVTFRACGTVLGLRTDGPPFTHALANSIIEIDHLGGHTVELEAFPKLPFVSPSDLNRSELQFYHFDPTKLR